MEAGKFVGNLSGNTVGRGIFAGMKIHPKSAFGVDQFTMLTGQYESELYGIVSAAANKGYDTFVDLGCANGFYAVGFALICPACEIIAFDIDAIARETTKLNAQLNNVSERVSVREGADSAELEAALKGRQNVFLLTDIEGAEIDVLDPTKCPSLSTCDLLVELHGEPEKVAGILRQRFEQSHRSRLIGRTPRNPFSFPNLPLRFEDDAWALVSEGRTFTPYNWLLLERTTAPSLRIREDHL